jgi:O-antigen ligase
MSSMVDAARGVFRPRPPLRHAHARLAAPLERKLEGLRFSDWLFVFVLGVATMLAISKPLFGFSAHHTILSHWPLAMFAPVFAFHFAGLQYHRVQVPWAQQFKTFWPLLALALFALAGSAYAKWMLDIGETYLAFGAYLLLLPLFASLCADPLRARAWVRALIGVWIVGSLAALVGEAASAGALDTLHEIEYLVAVGFFAMYYVCRSWVLKLLAIAMMVAAVVLNQKLTGFIVTALAVLHIVLLGGQRALPKNWRGAYVVGAAAVTAALVATLTVLYFEFREFLPSGNPHVRLAQYEQAWLAFKASPIWGNAYMEASGEMFREGFRLLYIPTHSDILDILKHGGLIALLLFLAGYALIFLAIQRAVAMTRDDHLLQAYFLTARFFQGTALLTFSFNPLLLKGPFLFVIWGHLAMAVGLAIIVARQQQAKAAA